MNQLLFLDLTGIVWFVINFFMAIITVVSLLVFIVLRLALGKRDVWVAKDFVFILVSHLILVAITGFSVIIPENIDSEHFTMEMLDIIAFPMAVFLIIVYVSMFLYKGLKFRKNKILRIASGNAG